MTINFRSNANNFAEIIQLKCESMLWDPDQF